MKPILSRRTAVKPSSARPSRRSPSRVMVPDVGRSSPPMRFSSVDFPDPDGPTMETISPFGISSVMSCSAVTRRRPSKCLLTCSRTIDEGATQRLCETFHKVSNGCLWAGKLASFGTPRCGCGPSRAPGPASRPCSRRSPSPRDPSQQAARAGRASRSRATCWSGRSSSCPSRYRCARLDLPAG